MTSFLLDREHGDAASSTTRIVLSGTALSEGSLCWSSTRIMSLLGWDGRTRNLEPDAGFRSEVPKWGKWFKELDIDINDHVRLSAKSLRAKGKAVQPDAPQFASVSSFGLYGLLSFYAGKRSTFERLDASRRVLETLITHCTDLPAANALSSTQDERNACAEDIDDTNSCIHLQHVCAGADLEMGSRPRVIAGMLGRGTSRLACPSCSALTLRILRRLASETDSNCQRWHTAHPEVAPVLTGPSGKKRRIEPLARKQIRESTTYTPGREDARTQWMSAMLHACRIELERPCSLALCMDGGRVAKPKKEINAAWLWLPAQRCAVFLPPKAMSKV
eukprot:5521794-Amphidinium_carterae.1